MATASASAASCGDGAVSRPQQQLHHLLHLRLLGAAVADDGQLDLGRRVFDDAARRPRRPRARRRRARGPSTSALLTLLRVKEVFDRRRSRAWRREADRAGRRECAEAGPEAPVAARHRQRAARDEPVAACRRCRRSRSRCGRTRDRSRRSSRQRGLDFLLVDVEVRPDVLGVVVILERVHQLQHLLRLLALELDVVLRQHRDLRRSPARRRAP